MTPDTRASRSAGGSGQDGPQRATEAGVRDVREPQPLEARTERDRLTAEPSTRHDHRLLNDVAHMSWVDERQPPSGSKHAMNLRETAQELAVAERGEALAGDDEIEGRRTEREPGQTPGAGKALTWSPVDQHGGGEDIDAPGRAPAVAAGE